MRSDVVGTRNGLRSVAGWLGVVTVLTILSVGAPARVVAQEHEPQEAVGAEPETTGVHRGTTVEHEGAEGHEEEHFHKHHLALFVGATEAEEHHSEGHHGEGDSSGARSPDFTLGIDYERRFSKIFGFGGMGDWVVEGKREWLVGPIAFLHPFGGAKLYAAPCYQHVREGDENSFVFRVGASWDFEVGKYSIGPNVIYDFGETDDFLVVGVGFGMGF